MITVYLVLIGYPVKTFDYYYYYYYYSIVSKAHYACRPQAWDP